MIRLTTRCLAALLTICLLTPLATRAQAEEISLATLLEEMTDRSRVAQLSDPWYVCAQFSSYDRASDDPDDIETWYANRDHSQFLRTEENDGSREHVRFDAAGPGAVVRFWSTWSVGEGRDQPDGTLRIYLDNAAEPVVAGPIAEVIDGGLLAGAPLGQGVSPDTPYKYRGHNLYLPIPYGRHCRITYENHREAGVGEPGGDILYYQINYRTYEKGTPVRTFTMKQLERYGELIERTQQRLRRSTAPESGKLSASLDGALRPGASKKLAFSGPAALTRLTVQLEATDIRQALRSTILEMQFDGEPCVWCPVGDFFGSGYAVSPYQSWYTKVLEDGTMQCWWVMPFRKNCTLTLRNVGEAPVEIKTCEALAEEWKWDDRSLHFHSTWFELQGVETVSNPGALAGAFDVNFVTVEGAGAYVGDTLTLFNSKPIWWGEGDEKIFVDGEDFPSHFGTGTEDYYGYAWGSPNYFAAPFHAQPYGRGAQARDMVVNSRYRSLDAIPFRERLQVDVELWHWRRCKLNYAPTTFWYARPGAFQNIEPDAAAAAAPVVIESSQLMPILKVKGAIEGETLEIAARSGGATQIQESSTYQWSNEQQVWWIDSRPGDHLDLLVPVPERRRYRVYACLTKAIDYGVVKFTFNEQPAARLFDRFNDGVATDEVALGVFNLDAGENLLRVEMVGMNPAEDAVHRHMFGLDYLRLEEVEK
ncbi:MAG: glycoside hydrolase family 172 protein [Phycisphaerales bacterium JB038]